MNLLDHFDVSLGQHLGSFIMIAYTLENSSSVTYLLGLLRIHLNYAFRHEQVAGEMKNCILEFKFRMSSYDREYLAMLFTTYAEPCQFAVLR